MEVPNEAGLAELTGRAQERSPVVMLNLLKFTEGGRERYAEYGAGVAPLLERAGARVAFAGEGGSVVLGDDSWDLVLLVEYPSRGAFLEMIGSPEYGEIAHLRDEALEHSELHPLDPADLP
jgi:uncharacterized protein (DUF1330 family)